jgi:hypothetical protein
VKQYLVGAAVAVGLVIAVGWVGSCNPPWDTAEAKALEQRADSLATLVRDDSLVIAHLIARNDSALLQVSADSARADSAVAAANAESAAHAQTASTLRGVLRGSVTDTAALNAAERLVTDMETRHAAARQADSVALALERSNVERLKGLNADLALQLVVSNTNATQAVAALEAEVAFWKEAAERQARGFLGLKLPKWVEPVVFASAGAYVGTLIK